MAEYVKWRVQSPAELTALVDRVIQDAALDPNWAGEIRQTQQAFTNEREQLDNPPQPPVPAANPPAPLPGVDPNSPCESVMDPSLLRFEATKAVWEARYHHLGVIEDAVIGALPDPASTSPGWLLGQKFEYAQEWRHAGFTLGSLISSMSLLPQETLTIEVASWLRVQTQQEQDQATTTDKETEYDQRRTDERATIDQAVDSSGWNVSASGSASMEGVGSLNVGGGYNSNSQQMTQRSQRQVDEATRKATTKISQTRATKITQTAESGSSTKTTRTIANPNACHTVTFNFFEVVRLIDSRLRLGNDAPVVLIPGLFPAAYSNGKPIQIPFGIVEAVNSPASFLRQYFELDRDLSVDVFGLALRTRTDPFGPDDAAPMAAVRGITEALIIAAKYLFRVDFGDQSKRDAALGVITAVVKAYADRTLAARKESLTRYSTKEIHQLTSPGVYVDSVLGSCSACEDYVESQRYTAAERADAERRVVAAEAQRRELRLAQSPPLLDAFDPAPAEAVGP